MQYSFLCITEQMSSKEKSVNSYKIGGFFIFIAVRLDSNNLYLMGFYRIFSSDFEGSL